MGQAERPPTDYRQHRRQTERRLLYIVVATLIVVGGGLIALIFGPDVGLSGLVCLLFGGGAIVGLWLLLTLAERWTRD